MFDLASATVHRLLGSADRSAERLDDRLVSQANSQDRCLGLKLLNYLEADAGLIWIARPRRKDNGRRVEALDLFSGYRIVANDVCITSQLSEIPREVVDEGVVVVDDQNHRWRKSSVGRRAEGM